MIIKNKIFLRGTCNDSTWRKELIPYLQIDYFDPVVENWTSECQAQEIIEKETKCNIHLYVITSQMKGVFSIAEAVDSVHCLDKYTMFYVLSDGFDDAELKSLQAVIDLIISRGGKAGYINNMFSLAENINNDFIQEYLKE